MILVTTNLFAENHDLYIVAVLVNTELLKTKINNDDVGEKKEEIFPGWKKIK